MYPLVVEKNFYNKTFQITQDTVCYSSYNFQMPVIQFVILISGMFASDSHCPCHIVNNVKLIKCLFGYESGKKV